MLLNAGNASKKCFITKNEIVNTNLIKSSCSENTFKIVNLKSLVHTNYLKISLYITIFLCMSFLSVKYVHSMIVSDVCFLQEMCTRMHADSLFQLLKNFQKFSAYTQKYTAFYCKIIIIVIKIFFLLLFMI